MADNNLGNKYQSYAQAVVAAQQGEQEAFRFLYESTYRDKFFIAQKYMKNETDAQDVLQDSYMKAWQNLDKLQEPDKFINWFSLIVANTALDALKKKKDLPFSAMEQASEDGDTFSYEEEDWRKEYQPEHAYTDQETSELLKELLDSLSDEQRFCMLMYYVEEHSVGEIAQLVGCSEGTVKSRLNYGRKNLKAKAEDLEKKGYTLYSIAPVPLLLLLLRKQAQTTRISIPALDMTVKTVATTAGKTTGAAANVSTGASPATTTSAATGNIKSAVTSSATMAAKTAGVSLAVKVAAAVLAVAVLGGGGYAISRILRPTEDVQTASADDSNSDDDAFLTAFSDSVSEQEDRHSYLLACIEAAGFDYQAEWTETLFDDWNGDGEEDVIFWGYSPGLQQYLICSAGTGINIYDNLYAFESYDPVEGIQVYQIPTDDGMHIAICYEYSLEYNFHEGSIIATNRFGFICALEENGPEIVKKVGHGAFSNPQHNSIDVHYVIYKVAGGINSEANATIVYDGETYTGGYRMISTADSLDGRKLYKEDESPFSR